MDKMGNLDPPDQMDHLETEVHQVYQDLMGPLVHEACKALKVKEVILVNQEKKDHLVFLDFKEYLGRLDNEVKEVRMGHRESLDPLD